MVSCGFASQIEAAPNASDLPGSVRAGQFGKHSLPSWAVRPLSPRHHTWEKYGDDNAESDEVLDRVVDVHPDVHRRMRAVTMTEEKPRRIQRKRVKGWKMPPNTVSVTRPGRFGNPVSVGDYFLGGDPGGIGGPFRMSWCVTVAEHADSRYTHIDTPAKAVDAFWMISKSRFTKEEIAKLRGKNLACFCALDQPCHADVLLELANAKSNVQP